jgi:hypothetical protein
VMLHPLESIPANAGLVHALINPSFRWTPPPVGESIVQLYCRESRPGAGLVVLQPDGGVLLGKVVELEAYHRRMRLLTIASVALVLIVAVLVGMLVVGKWTHSGPL